MGLIWCHFFHKIRWYSDMVATDKSGTIGVFGKCKCGRQYFWVMDTNMVFKVPKKTLIAMKIKKIKEDDAENIYNNQRHSEFRGLKR